MARTRISPGEPPSPRPSEPVIELLDAVIGRLDTLIESTGGTFGGSVAGGRPVIAGAPSKPGDFFTAKPCDPIVINLAKEKCWLVAITSGQQGKNVTVDVSWTDDKGVVVPDAGLKPGENTECRCKMVKVQVHVKAGTGHATFVVQECKP
jgi:hypothetical protein